jgi:hypothetical protein
VATVIRSETRRIADSEAFDVCDVVSTDYSGKVTRHIIMERFKTRNSQTGVTYKVVPQVPKSGGLGSKIDHGWFKRLGHLELNDNDKIIFVPDNTEG